MEYHPRINLLNSKLKQSKIILGSFPTWALTEPNLDKNETIIEKEEERTKNGDVSFFYGSTVNRFWDWYRYYVDENISKNDITSIENSLHKNSIGITDVILSCERKDKSALDKHLTKRTYNYQFFEPPEHGKSIKILCTSKGVMNEMLLSNKFFNLHPQLEINIKASNAFQKQIIKNLKGDLGLVKHPFYRLIQDNSGGTIECFSVPSPGSPFRRLVDFGFTSENAKNYLNNYLKVVFDWFIS